SDDYNYTVPETGAASFQPYRPRVYRYDITTQRYELIQMLDPQNKPHGLAAFTAAGRHYVVVHKIIYVYNKTSGK
ncbi:hypothetical protein LSAT2_032467, partial [Lamellibrachia satsuma]